jgi:hypothetical protein
MSQNDDQPSVADSLNTNDNSDDADAASDTKESSDAAETSEKDAEAAPAADGEPKSDEEPKSEEEEETKEVVPPFDKDPSPATEATDESTEAIAEATDEEPSSDMKNDVEALRLRAELMARVSGLDRGVLADQTDVEAINETANHLEARLAHHGHKIDWGNAMTLSQLDGRWRLAYTSAFAPGRLGGGRSGQPTGGPVKLGKVFQDIDTSEKRLINAIEPLSVKTPQQKVNSPLPLPPLEFDLPPIVVNVGLGHKLEMIGPDELKITGDGVKVESPLPLPPLELKTPKLPFADEIRELLPEAVQDALAKSESSTFRVSYLDDSIRLSRGDRDELRVFVRA